MSIMTFQVTFSKRSQVTLEMANEMTSTGSTFLNAAVIFLVANFLPNVLQDDVFLGNFPRLKAKLSSGQMLNAWNLPQHKSWSSAALNGQDVLAF